MRGRGEIREGKFTTESDAWTEARGVFSIDGNWMPGLMRPRSGSLSGSTAARHPVSSGVAIVPSEVRSPRLAVLIDADNVSAKIADALFEEIAKIGEASVRRIYGDFSNPRSKAWADTLSKHANIPQQQFAYTTGKNASDITLVIDAMDLLHSGRLDGFCLVSSDSDFTRLAARIREQGVDVFGFGERKTPESFRQACRRFGLRREPASGLWRGEQSGWRLQASSAAQRSRADHHQDHCRDGKRRWLGSLGRSRKTTRQPGVRFRSAKLRLPQAERPGAKDRRIRSRSSEGRRPTNSLEIKHWGGAEGEGGEEGRQIGRVAVSGFEEN